MSDPKRTIQPEAVMAETDIPALRALLEKATKGPWGKRNKVGYVLGADCVVAQCGDFADKELVRFNAARWNADADLIVAAVNALPALLDELEGLREAVEKAAKQFRFYEREHRRKAADSVTVNPDRAGSEAKARTNREFAEMCEAALNQRIAP
jgi:hypothetical protein